MAPTAVGEWSHFPFPGLALGVCGEEVHSQNVGRLPPKVEASAGPMGQMQHEAASSGRSLHSHRRRLHDFPRIWR